MKLAFPIRWTCCLLVLSGAVLAGGCTKEITIVQYPTFYTDDMRGMPVAVVPFTNATQDRNAGDILSDKVASAMTANGTYQMFNAAHLKAIMDERSLQAAMADDPMQAAQRFRDVKGLQAKAILVGTVTNYTATQRNERKQDPVYQFNPHTKMTYVAGYRTYTVTRNEANVAITATLIRLSDGKPIYTTPQPITARAWAQGSPPSMDPFACLQAAGDRAASDMMQQFCIVRKKIKVKPKEVLKTASELYDNQWTYTNKFPASAEKMYVVIKLPAACDRNRFRMAIVRKESRTTLAEQEVTWSKDWGTRGYQFNPGEIARKGGGAGTYTIKFYAGPEPVFTEDFRITP